jgi:hypothetical protein
MYSKKNRGHHSLSLNLDRVAFKQIYGVYPNDPVVLKEKQFKKSKKLKTCFFLKIWYFFLANMVLELKKFDRNRNCKHANIKTFSFGYSPPIRIYPFLR